MKEYAGSFIRDLIKSLLDEGYVDLKEGTYSMLKLNARSMKVLKGKESVVFKILNTEEPVLDPVLFEKLKHWRKEKAYKERIRPYIIFSDTSLISICNTKPKTLDELLEIRGVGTKKIENYGEEILNLINS